MLKFLLYSLIIVIIILIVVYSYILNVENTEKLVLAVNSFSGRGGNSVSVDDVESNVNVLHVVSMTHWDREWYMTETEFSLKLVDVVDDVLDNENLNHFLLDGTSAPLLDYLRLRPEKKSAVAAAVRSGKLGVGPWFVQPDEFLASSEALIRNLHHGMNAAAEAAAAAVGGGKEQPQNQKLNFNFIGYLPDTFGHAAQLPSLYKGFHLPANVLWRGVSDSAPALFLWDGLLTVNLKQGYCFGGGVPNPDTEPADVVANWFADRWHKSSINGSRHALILNGCDHTALDPYVVHGIDVVNRHNQVHGQDQVRYNFTVIHSSLNRFVDAVKQEGHHRFPQINDTEFRERVVSLASTLSTRHSHKRLYWSIDKTLVSWIEPFGAVDRTLFDRGLVDSVWRRFLLSHAHDSICSSVVTAVDKQIEARLYRAQAGAAQLASRTIAALTARVRTQSPSFVVWNPSARARGPGELVVGFLDLPLNYDVLDPQISFNNGQTLGQVIEDVGGIWTYALPDRGFRKPYNVRRYYIALALPSERSVPGFGWNTYELDDSDNTAAAAAAAAAAMTDDSSSENGANVLQNDVCRVELMKDGSVTVWERDTSTVLLERGNLLEFRLDFGDVYNAGLRAGDQLYAAENRTKIQVWTAGPVYQQARVDLEFDVASAPLHQRRFRQSADGATIEMPGDDRSRLDPDSGRGRGDQQHRQQPSSNTVHGALDRPFRVTLFYLLARRGAGQPEIAVRWVVDNNEHENFRLSATFAGPWHHHVYSGSVFKTQQRTGQQSAGAAPHHEFVRVCRPTGRGGLVLGTRGHAEHRMEDGHKRLFAMTLLRATAALGDWGEFETGKSSQEPGPQSGEYTIIVYGSGSGGDGAVAMHAELKALHFANPLVAVQAGPGTPLSGRVRDPGSLLINLHEQQSVLTRSHARPHGAVFSGTTAVPVARWPSPLLLPESGSFLQIDTAETGPSVRLTSLKPSWDGTGIVFRVHNSGVAAVAVIHVNISGVASDEFYYVSLNEREMGEKVAVTRSTASMGAAAGVPSGPTRLELKLDKNEIKTVYGKYINM